MNTKQAIQASANVIRITSVSAGDVYKRFDESYDDRIYYGVVKNVHNDGENAVIESVEYCQKYNDLDVTLKVIKGDKDYIIFPSTPEELNLELDGARNKKVREVGEAEKTISKAKKIIEEIDGLISGETLKNLRSAGYKELSQSQYLEKKKELAG